MMRSLVYSGFVAKKQKPKDIVDYAEQRRGQWEQHDDAFELQHDRPDPHGRLASWIRINARPYLPIRHPRTTLNVHVSAGLYQIVDLIASGQAHFVRSPQGVWAGVGYCQDLFGAIIGPSLRLEKIQLSE
ncbi:unnamed protein product [Nippostrongylus brasiliensis]|uniref:Oxidoreductase n=1 Tax=Nippostrongylus brasiliensis TaxID=27835 RepID=A0A158QWP5_NIPBR|nr:unnamed protein product [Nippostrongylus brasiliensis]